MKSSSLFARIPSIRPWARREKHLALPPGSLVHFGAKRSEEFSVETTIYNTEVLEESSSLEIPALSADHRDTVT
ncbi:MAG: hypothetical protein P1U85_22655 [Verrucomicrobiales bacterium]|nr:hypothetical protein [Verrucomicrobiales bacterium]